MFQNDFGPPKHVLHLVWSVLGISTAIKTALKVALYDFFDGPLAPLNGQFMEKVNHYNKTKHKDFLIEVDGGITADTAPSVVSAGADILVAGSAVFSNGSVNNPIVYGQNIKRIREAAESSLKIEG